MLAWVIMTIPDLEHFLFDQIPLVQVMGVKIVEVNSQRSEIQAPLEQNRNHLGTAFGGSLHSMMVLSGYLWLFQNLDELGHKSHVVLAKSTAEYLKPVTGLICATCEAPDQMAYQKFLFTFEAKGRARIALNSRIKNHCVLVADFVAIKASQPGLD
jgi:thioesterase domain-containing protein